MATAGADEGPILLNLNPPLLAAPLQEEPPLEEEAQDDAKTEVVDENTPSEAADSSPEPKLTPAKTEAKNEAEKPPVEPDGATNDTSEEVAPVPTKVAVPPRPPLSPEMVSLRDAVRRTLAYYFKQPFNTRDNTAANMMQVCLAFGCDAEVRRDGASGPKLNGVTCLCWNYPCAGHELLGLCEDHIVPRIGYGYQEHPSQFLAVLALSRVPPEYPIRVGEDVRKVADLVEYEKLSCRVGTDLSFKLIALARYLSTDETWKNDLGETWSVSRLVREELARPQAGAPHGGTYRLLALSYVVDRRVKRGEPVDGQFKRAEAFIARYHKYAMELQNPDGSWHPRFFAYRGQGGTAVEQVLSTGHILRWLAFSLPEDQLRDPRVVRSVVLLTNLLADTRYRAGNLPASNTREIAARLGAVHALMLYDQRIFKPHDKVKQPETQESKDEVALMPSPELR